MTARWSTQPPSAERSLRTRPRSSPGVCGFSRKRPERSGPSWGRFPRSPPSLPAPPTYAACLYLEETDPFAWLRELGIDIAQVLHASQSFRYFDLIHAGDRLTFTSRIANVFQKKSGTRTFVVKLTDVTNQHGARVAEMRATLVVRSG